MMEVYLKIITKEKKSAGDRKIFGKTGGQYLDRLINLFQYLDYIRIK